MCFRYIIHKLYTGILTKFRTFNSVEMILFLVKNEADVDDFIESFSKFNIVWKKHYIIILLIIINIEKGYEQDAATTWPLPDSFLNHLCWIITTPISLRMTIILRISRSYLWKHGLLYLFFSEKYSFCTLQQSTKRERVQGAHINVFCVLSGHKQNMIL